MTANEKIRMAIREAVVESGQKETLADLLITWFDAASSGKEDVDDSDASDDRLEALYAGTEIESSNYEEEE